jgi:hypothetical protein
VITYFYFPEGLITNTFETLVKILHYENDKIMKTKKTIILWGALTLLTIGKVFGQVPVETIPAIIEKNGRHTLLVDGQPWRTSP